MPDKSSRTLIYDGDCGFCLCWVNLGRKLDWLRKVEWLPRLDPSVPKRFPQTNPEQTKKRMVSVRPDGKTYEGFYALRDLMLRFPLVSILGVFFYIPGAARVGVPAYDWVARNRSRFKGTRCAVK